MLDATNYDEVHDVGEAKPVSISVHLITRRNLPCDATSWPQDKIVTELNNISHLRLDRENIREIDGFELLGPRVTNLYLQHNCIEKIENLQYVQNVCFLTLSGNKIRVLEGLAHLSKLSFLDLSHNHIKAFDIDELPQSLIALNLSDNPCTTLPDYRGRIVQDLPKLRQLDNESVTRTERLEAGYTVSDDEDDGLESDEEINNTSQDTSLGTTTADILWRSQSRMEDMHKEHKRRLTQLSHIRDDTDLPPFPTSRSGLKM